MDEKQYGILPIRNIFFKLAIPGLFAMLFSSIGMMIDGLFVGRVIGSDALAAVNLVFPIIMIIFALADMLAAGSSVRISIYLGEKKDDEARNLFTVSMLLLWALSIVFMVMGIIFGKKVIFYFIKDKYLAYLALEYAKGFIILLPFIMPMFAVDNYLRNCGKVNYSMYVGLLVSILNIVLDIYFIGYLKLGIFYASLATSLSMSIGTIISLIPFVTNKTTLKFVKPKINIKEIVRVLYNGSSELFNNISGSLMAIITNGILLSLGGATAVASYSIIMYIDAILMSILYGIQDSIKPAVSYNLGAQKIDRTFALFKICSVASLVISVSFIFAIVLFPDFLIGWFLTEIDVAVSDMAKTALYLYAPSYIFTWFNMICSSFLTSFDKPKESIIIMMCKSVVFPIISLIVMVYLIGLNAVFITPFIASVATFFVSISIWKKTTSKYK